MSDFYGIIKQNKEKVLQTLREQYVGKCFYSTHIDGNKNHITRYVITDIYSTGLFDEIVISHKYISVDIEYDKDGNTIVNISKEQSKTHASYPEAYQSDYTNNKEEIKALLNYLIIKYNIQEAQAIDIQKVLCLI